MIALPGKIFLNIKRQMSLFSDTCRFVHSYFLPEMIYSHNISYGQLLRFPYFTRICDFIGLSFRLRNLIFLTLYFLPSNTLISVSG